MVMLLCGNNLEFFVTQTEKQIQKKRHKEETLHKYLN